MPTQKHMNTIPQALAQQLLTRMPVPILGLVSDIYAAWELWAEMPRSIWLNEQTARKLDAAVGASNLSWILGIRLRIWDEVPTGYALIRRINDKELPSEERQVRIKWR